ncbi:MAG: hypothetical protein MI864_12925 [Pseudomonadales bacterium]|uniref:Uncharacterized protein n=1 Tax=Oleiphilus messinensis TaxID=141451 RepID=A0A1Y0IH62_9GAMM|nr:hypothetical protein [Oleiphilus messinensis]ARU58743.1 hypothetical protein OLMES_4754 [Oleiphilus messinensis]MCG8611430.1 hypothetical protein [Pseudomonadales bacterium]
MSSVEESRQGKVIDELKTFIKKVLSDPGLAQKCMEIARELKDEPDAQRKIAEAISSQTVVRIPEVMSEADKMFIEIIHDVLEDESALY